MPVGGMGLVLFRASLGKSRFALKPVLVSDFSSVQPV